MPDSFHDSARPATFPGNDAHRDRISTGRAHREPAVGVTSFFKADPADRAPLSSGTIHHHFGRPPGRLTRVGKLLTDPAPNVIAALITARASGNCEVMAAACTYGQSTIFSRRRRLDTSRPFTSPSDGIAACPNCLDLLEHIDLPTALDLGYLVDARTPTSVSPVLWRQHRWVYLDIRGRVQAAGSALSSEAS